MYRQSFFLISFILLALGGSSQNDPVLFTVEDTEVRVSEFDYIYSKNNASRADYSQASLEEYLDLYVNFKLKVAEARTQQIDTLESYVKELSGYRRQLADSYIVERELAKTIAKEAYDRQQEDIEIAHIFFKLPKNASKKARLDAYTKAEVALSALKKGRSWEETVQKYSEEEKSKKKKGHAGYITAILPEGYYALESAVYDTPMGKTSEIVRSPMGLHIIKILSKRPARGKMSIAHILIREKYKGVMNAYAQRDADAVYDRLKKGESFKVLASQLSQDNNTKLKGGFLGEFGIGRYESSFEDAAFGLKKDGDFSRPVKTTLGYHIIQRVGKAETQSFDEIEKELIKSTKQKDRQEAGKQKLNAQIKVDAGHVCNDDVLVKFIDQLDANFFEFKWKVPEIKDEVLCELGGEKYMLSEFAQFCKKQGRIRMQFPDGTSYAEGIHTLYTKYTDQKAIDYQQNRLEEKYIDFRNLMREYEEGILLFEVTKDEVWDKASNDSVGILKYFEKNRTNYFWPERAEVEEYSLRTTDAEVIGKILKKAGKNDAEKVANSFNEKDDQTPLVMWKDKIYEKGAEEIATIPWKKGGVSAPNINSALRMATFQRVKSVLPKKQKSLDEARGFVISDYQQVLEQEWIEELRVKYKVQINEKVLKKLIKN